MIGDESLLGKKQVKTMLPATQRERA
jgi:hypothetical protein